MKKIIYHCGIDVDDKNFNVALRNSLNGEIIELKCIPSISALKKKLTKLDLFKYDLRFCYEASYSGFTLYRQFQKHNINCEVIAPSLIPKKPGEKVKTDRIDAKKLAEYYAKGDLTIIYIPNEDDEIVRDILRSRKLVQDQLKNIRRHILALCRRNDMNYRESIKKQTASHWTYRHYCWIKKEVKRLKNKDLIFNITTLLNISTQIEQQLEEYDERIIKLSTEEKYKKKVQALRCFKGLETLSSMTLITELGDINRFDHPSKLASYAGMNITEYSSGGKERRFSITKQGNKHIRTTVVEACQFAFTPTHVSKALHKRRNGADQKQIDIADRCMNRLRKKSNKLLFRGKPKNKVKVACAREMLCFIWEVLKTAS